MSACAGSIEDPEKHFLGDLLAEDDVFVPTSPHRDGSSVSSTNSSSSVGVGASSASASAAAATQQQLFWPEPPPPYSAAPPWVSVPTAPANHGGGDFGIFHSTLKHPEWSYPLMDNHHQAAAYTGGIKPILIPAQTTGRGPFGLPPHHHLVASHHHYSSSPAIVTSPAVPPAPIGTAPRPLSYRDVANRQCVGARGDLTTGPRTSSSSSLGHSSSSGGSASGTPSTGTAPTTPQVRSDLVLPSFASGDSKMNGEEFKGRKHAANGHETEFQRITRKKAVKTNEKPEKTTTTATVTAVPVVPAGVKKNKAPRMVAAPVAPQVEEVDARSRFDILQKLAPNTPAKSPTTKTIQAAPVNKTTCDSSSRSSSASRPDEAVDASGVAVGRGVFRRVVGAASATKKRRDDAPGQVGARHRTRPRNKKDENLVLQYLVLLASWLWGYVMEAAFFCYHLIADIFNQLCTLGAYSFNALIYNIQTGLHRFWNGTVDFFSKMLRSIRQFDWRTVIFFWKPGEGGTRRSDDDSGDWGLDENIALPSTGEEAMERLLRCRGQDAYVILGLRADCSDEAIKRHYKRQAVLVHPDKNTSQGADEAFKVLSKAFEMIGTPEARLKYNIANIHKDPLHKEMEELWEQLRQKVEEARETMACDCGRRHRRVAVPSLRPAEARFCRRCNTRHSAKQNEIWSETRFLGFFWIYYACIDGAVYDITQWATCEHNHLKHMKPNAHAVQYRLVSSANPPPPMPPTGAGSQRRHSRDNSTDDFLASIGSFTSSSHSQVSFRPPERRVDDERPRRAGRRKKIR